MTHDYKASLPRGGKTPERQKLLAGLGSCANAAGGILVVGLDQATWTLPGVAGWNEDSHVKQLDDVSRLTVPPLPQLRHRTLTRDGAPPIALVGVSRSLAAPHAIKLEPEGWRYWARSNRGKHEMDVTELRRSFLEADQWDRDAEAYRLGAN